LYCFEFIYGRSISLGCHQGGFGKIIGVQHGVWSRRYLRASAFIAKSDKHYLEYNPDYYITDAKLGSSILIEAGIPRKQIMETGPLRYEKLFQNIKKRKVNKAFNEDNISILVLPGHNDADFVLKFVYKLLTEKDINITFKFHPKTSSKYKNLINNTSTGIKFKSRTPILELYKKSDIVISTYSSGSLEAVLYGKPIVILKKNNLPDLSVFSDIKSDVLSCYTVSELIEHLSLLEDEKYRKKYIDKLKVKLLENVFGVINLSPSNRVVNYLELL
jgi:surface carbohydrate biosynthesis protein (TIGR04326 family)